MLDLWLHTENCVYPRREKVSVKRPMLACSLNSLDDLKFPLLASPKIDGFRCLKLNGKALTRSFKNVPNKYVRDFIESRFPDNLDGELIVEGESFSSISSKLRSFEGKPNFSFHVFDYVDKGLTFSQRYNKLREILEKVRCDRIKLVKHKLMLNIDDLLSFERKCLKEGYEGVMMRSTNGLYKEGRSTLKQGWLVKLKRFKDSEARVIGFEEQLRNDNPQKENELGMSSRSTHKENMIPTNTLGNFIVEDLYTKKVFKIGTGKGLTAALRKNIWENRGSYIGEIIKYKYQSEGVKDLPRIPIWLGFRPLEDL